MHDADRALLHTLATLVLDEAGLSNAGRAKLAKALGAARKAAMAERAEARRQEENDRELGHAMEYMGEYNNL